MSAVSRWLSVVGFFYFLVFVCLEASFLHLKIEKEISKFATSLDVVEAGENRGLNVRSCASEE
jgi:hypothetical protein